MDARIDHVAVAVPRIATALHRWRDELGGTRSGGFDRDPRFRGEQYRFRGGARLELIEPKPDAPPDSFLVRFLRRFGARIHHVTLLVPDLLAAMRTLERAGYDVVDVADHGPRWREAFLRPSQVGGIVVQIAATDEARRRPPPPDTGAVLRGPTLAHPDLAAARRLWTLLGAEVSDTPAGLRARWADAPLDVEVVEGPTPGPVALRFVDTAPLPADPELGPAVVVDSAGDEPGYEQHRHTRRAQQDPDQPAG